MAVRRKLRRLKRFAYLGGLVGIAVGAKRIRDQRSVRPAPLGPPTAWPPLQAAADVPVAAVGALATDADSVDAHEAPPAGAAWVEPLEDGGCPLSHPIKANDNSQIFHEPGGRFYERTHADRCYDDAASARADGYRAAKGAGGAASGGTS